MKMRNILLTVYLHPNTLYKLVVNWNIGKVLVNLLFQEI